MTRVRPRLLTLALVPLVVPLVAIANVAAAGGGSDSGWQTLASSGSAAELASGRARAGAHEAAGARDAALPAIADPGSDVVNPEGDIVDHSVDYRADGSIVAVLLTAVYDPPTSTNWQDGATFAFWDFDVDLDGTSDVYATMLGSGGGVVAGVLSTDDDAVLCVALPAVNVGLHGYRVTFPASCINTPASMSWFTTMQYDDLDGQLSVDRSPDTGWAGPVVNPLAPPTTTPPPTTPPTPPATCAPSAPPPAPTIAGGYASMVPSRLLDTRAGFSTIDCLAAGTGAVAAGSETSLPITGRAGIPGDATAVVLNVAVTDAQGPGFITAYPCGQPRPTAANLNYVAGSTVPNLVIAKIGAGGAVCLFSFAATQIIADVNGYFPAGSSFTAITPARVLETRPGYPGDQTAGAGSLGLAAGSTTEVQIGGRLGVPADAAGVALNVAAISPQSGGYITVFPCDTARPVASSLNYTAGAVTPNAVTAAIGAGGKVCIYTYAATHLAVDVNGYFAAGSTYVPLRPGRVADTRPGAGFGGTGAVTGGSFITVNPGMYPGGIPVRSAVVLNVAVTDAQAGGFVTAYPCDQPRPNAANLNYAAGQTVANEVIAKVAADGTVCLFVLGTTHVVVDLNGYFPA